MYNIIRTRLVRVIRHFVFDIYFFFLILELALIICSLVKILFRAFWAIYYRYFDWYTRGRYDILLQLRRRGDSYHQSHVSPRPRASVVVDFTLTAARGPSTVTRRINYCWYRLQIRLVVCARFCVRYPPIHQSSSSLGCRRFRYVVYTISLIIIIIITN